VIDEVVDQLDALRRLVALAAQIHRQRFRQIRGLLLQDG